MIGDACSLSTILSFAVIDTVTECGYVEVLHSKLQDITAIVGLTSNFMRICWGDYPASGVPNDASPAIEASLYFKTTPASSDYSSLIVRRITADPFISRNPSNGFGSATSGSACTVGGRDFAYGVTLQPEDFGTALTAGVLGTQNGLQFMRVRLLYNTTTTHPIAVSTNFSGNSSLPSQGKIITSIGTSGDATRKLRVFQGWSEIPEFLENAIYSGTGIVKDL